MAHWAKINEDGIVENVIVTSNEENDEGESWIAENLEGTWVKTSYNTRKNVHSLGGEPLRKNFAQPGFTYNVELDAFIPPKAEGEEGFILNEELGIWVPPVAVPADADFVAMYGPDFSADDVAETSKVYFWITDQNAWGMASNADYPRPDGDFYWHPIEKEWQLAEEEKPEGSYAWDPINKVWVEVEEPTT
jgi:hypothetical protein